MSKQKESEIESLFNGMGKLYSDQRKLAAIWLNKPVFTDTGKQIRIAPDTLIYVKDGQLIDLPEGAEPTHKVIECLGALVNQFQLVLTDLKTNEPLTINI